MRAGRIAQAGTPRQIFRQPASRFVAEFIGETNLLSGTVEGGALCTPHGLRLAIPAGLAEGSKATAVLRPTDFILGGAGITGAVTRAIYMGADLHLHLAPKGGGPEIGVIARDSAEAPREGATVTLGYDPATMHLMERAE